MSRLRALAEQATDGRQDTTDVIVRAASAAVAREALGEIAPDLAVLLADAKDALAARVSSCCPHYWPDREDSDDQCEECATARALLARIEELEGKE